MAAGSMRSRSCAAYCAGSGRSRRRRGPDNGPARQNLGAHRERPAAGIQYRLRQESRLPVAFGRAGEGDTGCPPRLPALPRRYGKHLFPLGAPDRERLGGSMGSAVRHRPESSAGGVYGHRRIHGARTPDGSRTASGHQRQFGIPLEPGGRGRAGGAAPDEILPGQRL